MKYTFGYIGGSIMTLIDLALETKDFEWAKRLYNLDDKTPTDKDEIKCELAEIQKQQLETYTDLIKYFINYYNTSIDE